jgi:WD40 repeat protein
MDIQLAKLSDIPIDIINSIGRISQKSDYIIVGTIENPILIFNKREYENTYTLYQTLGENGNTNIEIGHVDTVTSVDVSNNGNIIVSSSVDETIKIWKRKMNDSYGLFQTLRYDSSPVSNVKISNDGTKIISGNMDKIIVWTRQSDLTYIFQQRLDISPVYVDVLQIIDNAKMIIAGCNDTTIIIWVLQPEGNYILTQRLGQGNNRDPGIGHTNSLNSINITNNINTIVSGSMDTTLIIWTRQSDGRYILTQRLGEVENTDRNDGHTGWVLSVNIVNDGNTIISGSQDHTLRIWERRSDGLYISYQILGEVNNLDLDIGHTSWVLSTSILNNGDTIISCGIDEIIIWIRQLDGFYMIQQIIQVSNATALKTFSRILSNREILNILSYRSDMDGVNKSSKKTKRLPIKYTRRKSTRRRKTSRRASGRKTSRSLKKRRKRSRS